MVSELFLVGIDADELLDRLVEARDLDDSDRSATGFSRVSPRTKARLQVFADALDRPQSSIIRQFIVEGLDRLEEELVGEV
jgi:hypothetical protein